MNRIVVDTSALIAVLANEQEANRILAALLSADEVVISTATLAEAKLVAQKKWGGFAILEELLESASIVALDFDSVHLSHCVDGYVRFGSNGQLNLGDGFAYGLARALSRPLLFKGNDFSQTDVLVAAW